MNDSKCACSQWLRTACWILGAALALPARAAPAILETEFVRVTPSEGWSVRSSQRDLGHGWRRFSWIFHKPGGGNVERVAARLRFLPGRGDLWEAARKGLHWIPNIKNRSEHIASDHVFRSPAVIMHAGRVGVAVLPDLDLLKRQRPVSQYLDMRFPPGEAPWIEIGFAQTKPNGHTYYVATGEPWPAPEELELAVEVFIGAGLSRHELLDTVSSRLWKNSGHQLVHGLDPQTAPFKAFARLGYGMALSKFWVQGPAPGSGGIALSTFRVPGGPVRPGREFENDLWFQSWFNNARTAYGLYKWGKELGERDWIERALGPVRLLMASPRDRGMFDTIFIPGPPPRWQSASKQHGGGPDVYQLSDNAWAALWLLRFVKDCEPVSGAEQFLNEFAERLIALQYDDGGFPGRVHKSSLAPDKNLDRGASGALALWFLAEMLQADKLAASLQPLAKRAIEQGLDFLKRNVVEPQRFEDFELFFSCSRKDPAFFDAESQLYGQNTLALQWTAEAFRTGYVALGRPSDLMEARFCTNLMNLYQQVWNPPYLDFHAFGGYGVMNTDAEWSDARQAQFAETNANMFEATGHSEYLERAVAALRASFTLVAAPSNCSVAPRNCRGTDINLEFEGGSAENYGHSGRNARSHQSGFHWGTGSALTSAAIFRERYGDLFVDFRTGVSIGIDSVAVERQTNGRKSLAIAARSLPGVTALTVRTRGRHVSSTVMPCKTPASCQVVVPKPGR